ncbi:MAG: T9SS type A sorting domain-containing protein [Ignavibacteriaceae bacterium]
MKSIIFSILIFSGLLFPQTVYDVTPGTKGNRIIISLANESKVSEARNIEVKLVSSPQAIVFNKSFQLIKIINGLEEKEASFSFDIKRNVEANKKDTIEFTIKGNGINLEKSFIINYTAPKEYALSQNFPNPFNPATTIRYDLPFDSKVSLIIYDILGSEVKTLVEEEQSAGYKEIIFNGSSFASGVYIYRLITNNPENNQASFVSIKKMMMIK